MYWRIHQAIVPGTYNHILKDWTQPLFFLFGGCQLGTSLCWGEARCSTLDLCSLLNTCPYTRSPRSPVRSSLCEVDLSLSYGLLGGTALSIFPLCLWNPSHILELGASASGWVQYKWSAFLSLVFPGVDPVVPRESWQLTLDVKPIHKASCPRIRFLSIGNKAFLLHNISLFTEKIGIERILSPIVLF